MSSRSHQVRVIVITIGKISAVIQEQVESVSLEICAISLQIILAELIDDEDYNQFRMGVIRTGRAWDTS
jgi:hypothetical protein